MIQDLRLCDTTIPTFPIEFKTGSRLNLKISINNGRRTGLLNPTENYQGLFLIRNKHIKKQL